jgi:hypothetical protein
MSEKRKHEDDVDIYGDLPDFLCVEDTVKKVNIAQDLYMYIMYRTSAVHAVQYYSE